MEKFRDQRQVIYLSYRALRLYLVLVVKSRRTREDYFKIRTVESDHHRSTGAVDLKGSNHLPSTQLHSHSSAQAPTVARLSRFQLTRPSHAAQSHLVIRKEGRKMVFGQIVVGPPGSGKTTYCNGMSQFLSLIGRKVAVINLDPANDSLPYDCAVNIEDLVKLSDVMVEHSLGPNGGLVYCMDYLEKNIDWLEAKLEPLLKDHYLLFDFPGQVELFFLHSSAKNVILKLIKKLNLRLTAVHLIDAHLCSDPGKYISALLLSLSTMLHLELPHINVLSKIDLIESYGKLAFNLDFYTDVQDLSYLQYHLDQDPRSAKYRKLTKELCDVIENFSLVSFSTLDIQDKESVGNLVKLIDKSNGYIFVGMETSAVEFSKIAVGPVDWDYYRVAAVQEKYMKDDDNE
ncbi:GPN-loop GTPase QQT1 [Glycine max]|nr:GPN-loop GTPase QQT1 [Glycine max]KAH1244519.1 GPN-loop GTPase QQT1 [Glycine max]